MRKSEPMNRMANAGFKKLHYRLYTTVRLVAAAAMMLLVSLGALAQTASPVTVTGFNADIIANGATFSGSVTADVDGGGYYLLNQSFTALGTPTYYLPNSGTINSVATTGVTFQLADASVNNSLRLVTQNTSGTLTFTTPKAAGNIYLLATSGSGTSVINATVNFSDGSTQVFTGLNILDWFYNTGFAIQGIGRTTATGLDGTGTDPRLYQLILPISGSNYLKQITGITFTKTSTAGYAQIMAVSIAATCTVPSSQPTSLVLNTVSTSQINGSFTAASSAADNYLVVRYPAGATPVAPSNGVTYTAGTVLGTGTVVQAGSATTFNATGLTGGTTYDFYVYSYNNTSCIGPIYNTTSPLTATQATSGCSGPGGVITVGPTGTYPTLTAALAALAGGISGSVILELQSNYTSAAEAFPITLASNACFSAARTLTIRPAAGANGLIIAGSNAGPAIDFSGANYVTIDGRPGGTGTSISVTPSGSMNAINLNIINTNAAGSAIRLDNGASNNAIVYCDLQGQNTTAATLPTTLSGVVYFGNNGANGNDNNTIDHCNIHAAGTGTSKPTIGIYSLGYDNLSGVAAFVTQFNDNNTISNNNIYDYGAASNSAGIELYYGNNSWTISGNSFFQTSAITITGYSRAIWLSTIRANAGEIGNGFTITANYIGGSAPACGGTPFTIASGSSGYFEGIRLEVADAATPQAPTSVQGNTITNLFITTSSTSDAMHAIAITGKGNLNIGTGTGNVIGAASGSNGYTDGGITITATGSVASHMLYFSGSTAFTAGVQNNKIGNVVLTAAGNSFSGIYINTPVTAGISNNSITNITASSTGTTTSKYIIGIQVLSASAVPTITNNIIQGIACNYATTGTSASQVIGINIGTAANISGGITGNIIRNLANATQSTATGSSSAIIGISTTSTNTAGTIVSGNIIDSFVLTGTATAAAVNVTGLYFSGTTSVTNVISKNFIHSFDAVAANTSAVFTGIYVNGGSSTLSNNMIRLGIKPDGTALTTALTINGILSATTSANNFYHNSIYIGGNGAGTNANNTYAFRRSATSGTYDIRDNIFANNRSNASTGGKHYAIYFTTSTTGATVNYNAYQYKGTGGVFAYNGTADVAAFTNGAATPGWISGDVNSVTGNPNFINPNGSAANVNLHISTSGNTVIEGTGTAIATVTNDYDGETRSSLTPVDIGADAGNFVPVAATCSTPASPTALVLNTISSTEIDGSFAASSGGADGYMIVRYFSGATPVLPVNGVNYTVGSTLGSGTVIAIGTTTSFASTGLVASTGYDYYVYAYNNNCLSGIKYSSGLTASKTTGGCSGPSGLITVGPTGTYPTLTAALAALSGGISGPVIVELQNNYTSATETFPIVIGASSCFSPANTVVIRPAANANGLVINSSNAGPTIDFSGGNYVTIDGRPGGTGSSITVTAAGSLNTINLNIVNTNPAGAAIRFDNQASANHVKYCDIQGQNASGGSQPTSLSGVIYFGNNGANGNDNNVIDHCNIHSAGTGSSKPSIAVYALGATNTGVNANFNDNDTISNCNIYDYFLSSGNSAGVELTQGVNGWVITGNSFFQTAVNTYLAAGFNRPVWISPNRNTGSVGNGFVITNNYIGGSAPLCGGTPYTLTALGNYFDAIRLEVVDAPVINASSVQGNTITNISITSTYTGDVFHGIAVTNSNGSVNIGTVTGNIIGAATGNDAITISAGSASATYPLYISNSAGGSSVINIKNNTLGAITLSGNGNSFAGIYDNNPGTVNITGNLIGSLTTPNSIYASNAGTTAQNVRGIYVPSGAGTFTIANNIIANLTNNTTSTTYGGSQTAGINISSSTAGITAITGNTIRNMYCATQSTGGSNTAALLGIGIGASGATTAYSVSGNTIHSLSTGATTAGVFMEGIFFYGSTTVTNIISKNFVHSFDITTGNTAVNIRGIEDNQGKVIIMNNMVRLGIRPDGTSLTNPVRIDGIIKGAGQDVGFYYNSVYIGGNNVAATTTSFTSAFRKETTNGTDDVRNNILINNRSNSSTGGTHFAISVNSSASLTFDHNIYGYGGTGGAFAVNNGANNTPTSAIYTSGWNAGGDVSSLVADPLFVDPVGPASTVDLHISTSSFSPANGAAVPIAGITDDFEGDVRDASTPDIGADEFTQTNGIDMQAVSIVSPAVGKGCYGNEVITIKVRNNSSVAIDFAAHPVAVQVNVTGAASASLSTTVNTGTLAAGSTLDVIIPATTGTVNMSASGTYIFDAKTSVAGDIKIANDAMQTTTRSRLALVSGTTAASQYNYCYIGAPVLTATGSNGYDSLHWQQTTDTTAGYNNITNGITSPFTSPNIFQTMYFRLAASCLTDTAYTPAIKIIVTSPQVTATTPATRCDKGVLNLQADATPGSQLHWYTDAIGGTTVGLGSVYTTPSISDTTTYYVSAVEGVCESARTPVTASVNHGIKITAQPVGQQGCPGGTVSFTVSATGTAITYQWRKDGVNITNATDSLYAITSASPSDAGTYDVVITGACGVVVSSAATLTENATNSWTGTISSDWNTAGNWCGGIPAATTDVAINAGTPYQPVVNGTASAHNITISSGASITVNAGGTLNIYGNYVNNGTFTATSGTVAFRGASNQHVDTLSVGNVIMNGSGGTTLDGNLTVLNTLTLTNGNIIAGSNDILLSNSASGSISSHIVTNGTGGVVFNNLTTSVTIPVGSAANLYNPVIIGNGQGRSYTIHVATGFPMPIADGSKAINCTWTITADITPSLPVDITLQYADADANAGASPTAAMDAGVYNGITWAIVSPAAGILPVGSASERQVSMSTDKLGAIVITNKGGILNTNVTSTDLKVQLMPTIISNDAKLRVTSPRAMNIEWVVTDAQGRMVMKFSNPVTAGTTDINLSFYRLSSGVYYLTGQTDTGKTPTIRLLVRH